MSAPQTEVLITVAGTETARSRAGRVGVPPGPSDVPKTPSRKTRLRTSEGFRETRNPAGGTPPYPRESATLQSTLPNCKADASHGEARPVAEFWKAHDAWKAGQVK